MPDQEPKYHPAVERALETSGQDMGRVKDKDMAHSLADTDDDLRGDKELIGDVRPWTERNIKLKIATDAALQEGRIAGQVAKDVVLGELPESDRGYSDVVKKVYGAADEAVNSYDDLKSDLHDQQHRELIEARKKLEKLDRGE